MNADLHMGDDLKNTGKGNLFVIFGEPDVDILSADEQNIQVRINGVKTYFTPVQGKSDQMAQTELLVGLSIPTTTRRAFFVRQAYFLGANDPYKSLKTSLKAEINKEAWSAH